MRITRNGAVIFCWSILIASHALAAPRNYVRAKLLADVSVIQPGKPFTVAVQFHIQPGWHIYWQNPGDAGQATAVTFRAPDGFDVAPLPFPLPKTFIQPGDIVGYGYEESLVLMATVTPPKDLKPGQAITLTADASWLCCQDVCIPGRAQPQLTLNVADTSQPANADLFAQWRARLPIQPGQARGVEIVKLNGAEPGAAPTPFGLVVRTDPAPKSAELFPLPGRSLELTDIQVRTEGTQITVRFKARLLAGQKLDGSSLPAVLAWTDDQDNHRGIRVVFPFKEFR